MTGTAGLQLQQQIEEVRREAFAAGYAAAMQVIQDLTSRSAPKDGPSTATPRRRRRRRAQEAAAPAAQPTRSRRARANGASAKTRRSAAHRAQRGTNALIIEEILKAMAPSAVRQRRSAKQCRTMEL